MNIQRIIDDESFFNWHDFAPTDIQYVLFAESEPSIIAAGHKIDDVFYSFANARASFIDSFADNFGDISDNDALSRLYAKTRFLTYALFEYAICLDLSWQVIWAFIQPTSFDYLIHQKYKEMEKECTSENVHIQLNCAISQRGFGFNQANKIKGLLSSFENDTDTLKVRKQYNSIKHCGMVHFEDLGANNDSMSISLNGKKAPILSRDTCRIEELEETLYNYHFKFESYFNSLIKTIMPSNYKEKTVPFVDYLNTLLKINYSMENESK